MNRIDDSEEVFKKRMSSYENETLPTIERLRNDGPIININGDNEVDKIHMKISSAVRYVLL